MATQRSITDFIVAEPAKGASKKKKKKNKILIEDQSEEVAAGTTIDSTQKSQKKEKKKKKKAYEEAVIKVEPEDTVQLDQCIVTKPKKKKKKTKVDDNGDHKFQEDVSLMSPVKVPADNVQQTSMKRQLNKDSESPSSPSKKKKKKHRKNSEKVVSVEDEDPLEVESENWTMEEELELLEKMKALAPKKDSKSCRVRLKYLNWNVVAFGGHSGENCKERFMEIYSRISTMKTLATIIEEAVVKVSSFASRKKQIKQPISRFYKDFLSKTEVKGPSVFVLASEAWKKLSAEQKDMYQAQYQEDLKKLVSGFSIDKRTLRKEFKDTNLFAMPRTPYHIWKVDGNKVTSSSSTKKSSSVFAKLKKHKKVPYIYLSLCEMIQFKKQVEEHLKDNPDFKAPTCMGPRKEELKIYLEEKGFPDYAAQKPFQIYMKDLEEVGNLPDVEEKELQLQMMEQFKRLPISKRNFYKCKVSEDLEEYRNKFLEWGQDLDEVTKFAKDQFFSGKNKHPYLYGIKIRNSKMSEVFPHKMKFGMSSPKFHDQPREPPKTAIKLFFLKYEHTSRFQKKFETPADKTKALKVYWNKLTEDQKATYSQKCEELKEVYKTRLLEYVDNMDKEMCKVYLGFLRRKIYKFFGYDIFEQAYPNAKYPVFMFCQSKTSKSSDDLSDLDGTDEEEEEEEEDAAGNTHEENSDEDQDSDDPDEDSETEESDEERESKLPTKSISSSRKGKESKLGGKTGNTHLAKGKKTQPSTQSVGKSDKLKNKLAKSKPAVVSRLGNTETVSKSKSKAGNELRKATNEESHDSEDDYESDNLDEENGNDDSNDENDESNQENDNDWGEENDSDGSDEEFGSKETNKNRITNTPIQQTDDESNSSSSSEKAMVRPAWLSANRGPTLLKREDTSEESESESD